MSDPASLVGDLETLHALYGEPSSRALVKEIDHLSDHYRAFVEAAPFLVLATSGPEGLDCSPRGDPPGFVRVADPRTLLIPDRLGNNRIDSLRNIVRDPRVALLFLIPGVGETLRVNGKASIDVDEDLRRSFALDGKSPRSVVRIHVGSVYFQCQKALARSRLWDAEARVERARLPTAGDIIQALSPTPFDGKTYDDTYPEHMKRTIY